MQKAVSRGPFVLCFCMRSSVPWNTTRFPYRYKRAHPKPYEKNNDSNLRKVNYYTNENILITDIMFQFRYILSKLSTFKQTKPA